jgi:hypothetical protein
VKKVNSEPGDRTPNGTEGKVLGSAHFPFQIKGQNLEYAYLIRWPTDDRPVFLSNLKVEEV